MSKRKPKHDTTPSEDQLLGDAPDSSDPAPADELDPEAAPLERDGREPEALSDPESPPPLDPIPFGDTYPAPEQPPPPAPDPATLGPEGVPVDMDGNPDPYPDSRKAQPEALIGGSEALLSEDIAQARQDAQQDVIARAEAQASAGLETGPKEGHELGAPERTPGLEGPNPAVPVAPDGSHILVERHADAPLHPPSAAQTAMDDLGIPRADIKGDATVAPVPVQPFRAPPPPPDRFGGDEPEWFKITKGGKYMGEVSMVTIKEGMIVSARTHNIAAMLSAGIDAVPCDPPKPYEG